jgi:hypothetical protein
MARKKKSIMDISEVVNKGDETLRMINQNKADVDESLLAIMAELDSIKRYGESSRNMVEDLDRNLSETIEAITDIAEAQRISTKSHREFVEATVATSIRMNRQLRINMFMTSVSMLTTIALLVWWLFLGK